MRRDARPRRSEVAAVGVSLRGAAIGRAIAALAARQKGLVTRRRLAELGMSLSAIDHRVKAGRLTPVFRAVYHTGYGPLPKHARELAAVLAYAPHAFVSHHTAGSLWRLVAPLPHAPIDITVPRGRGEGQPGIRLHRVRQLQRNEVRQVDGIPVTSAARTLLDLAPKLPLRQLEQAYAEAHAKHLVSESALLHLLDRHRGRPGTPKLRSLLEASAPALTRSDAEEHLLALIRRAGLSEPNVNAQLGPYEVDFLWREPRLIVEIDGFAFHSSRTAFERDRARDAQLQVRGWRVVRITWRQLVYEPERVVATLASLLASA
jgi:very-short-patch-repair endonuclease